MFKHALKMHSEVRGDLLVGGLNWIATSDGILL